MVVLVLFTFITTLSYFIVHTVSIICLCISTITFVLDHEYAGDCAALGVEYQAGDNDYEIIVSVDKLQHDCRLSEYMRAVSNY